MSDAIKDFIAKAKSIPLALYHLVLINIIMVIGFICKDLTVLYMAGSFLFVALLLVVLGKATGQWESPKQLVSENVQARLTELR